MNNSYIQSFSCHIVWSMKLLHQARQIIVFNFKIFVGFYFETNDSYFQSFSCHIYSGANKSIIVIIVSTLYQPKMLTWLIWYFLRFFSKSKLINLVIPN